MLLQQLERSQTAYNVLFAEYAKLRERVGEPICEADNIHTHLSSLNAEDSSMLGPATDDGLGSDATTLMRLTSPTTPPSPGFSFADVRKTSTPLKEPSDAHAHAAGVPKPPFAGLTSEGAPPPLFGGASDGMSEGASGEASGLRPNASSNSLHSLGGISAVESSSDRADDLLSCMSSTQHVHSHVLSTHAFTGVAAWSTRA